jgi:hypothetical protein
LSRPRNNLQVDAETATVNQILTLRDSCSLFDKGGEHQFISMAVSMRALCHDGSSGSLLNSIREKGREFPSCVSRNLHDLDTGASDHFAIAQVDGDAWRILPRLEFREADMKKKKFKHWWREIVITDQRKSGLSRGGVILAIANSEGGAHFTATVDEIYDDLARCNGLGLFSMEQGSWRTYGLAPIQATVGRVDEFAIEFRLGIPLRNQA